MGSTTPQQPKIQARPIQLTPQTPKISVGDSDTAVRDNSLTMKRKGKKQTRATYPANSGLNMGG